jgi:hypothetical protein
MTKLSLEEIKRRQGCCGDFTFRMDCRMIFGHFRYGDLSGQAKNLNKPLTLDHLKRKLKEYEETGNKELLIDIANDARLEYNFPEHPNAHFSPQDQGASALSRTAYFHKKHWEWDIENRLL